MAIKIKTAAALERRTFRLLQEPGTLRTATHAPGDPSEQREHLVVPVVALVEGVIHPVNAATPELVLAEELAPTVGAWNGEPVCWDHPERGGERVSANVPEILEQYMIGRLFNARLEDKRLKVEAWIDVKRCEALGGKALETLERIRAGEMIEVSVGAFVLAETMKGTHNGKRFAAVWREIGPDHLAMLPAEKIGACDIGMGCGAPRAASAKRSAQAYRVAGVGIRAAAEGLSDNDIRELLREALVELEGGSVEWLWVEAVFGETVIYSVRLEGEADEQLFERDYSLEGEAVTLGEGRRDVERIVSYEVMQAGAGGRGLTSSGGPLHVLSADGLLLATESTEEGPVTTAGTEGGLGKFRTLAERFGKGIGRFFLRNSQGDLSDSELRQMLDAALFATEPAFVGVEAVFPERDAVVYLVAPDGELRWFERSFTIADDNEITFGEAVEVAPVTKFEPVNAAAACGCENPANCQCGSEHDEGTMKNKRERIAALIANENTHFTAADAAGLEALSDETLEQIEEQATAEPTEPKPAATPKPAAEPKPAATPAAQKPAEEEEPVEEPVAAAAKPEAMTEEAWLENAPPRIRQRLQRELQREAGQRALIVERLKAAQDVYTEEQLTAMSLEELERTARLCGAGAKGKRDPLADLAGDVDFSGLGMPRASSAKAGDDKPDPAPSLRAAVAARNGGNATQ